MTTRRRTKLERLQEESEALKASLIPNRSRRLSSKNLNDDDDNDDNDHEEEVEEDDVEDNEEEVDNTQKQKKRKQQQLKGSEKQTQDKQENKDNGATIITSSRGRVIKRLAAQTNDSDENDSDVIPSISDDSDYDPEENKKRKKKKKTLSQHSSSTTSSSPSQSMSRQSKSPSQGASRAARSPARKTLTNGDHKNSSSSSSSQSKRPNTPSRSTPSSSSSSKRKQRQKDSDDDEDDDQEDEDEAIIGELPNPKFARLDLDSILTLKYMSSKSKKFTVKSTESKEDTKRKKQLIHDEEKAKGEAMLRELRDEFDPKDMEEIERQQKEGVGPRKKTPVQSVTTTPKSILKTSTTTTPQTNNNDTTTTPSTVSTVTSATDKRARHVEFSVELDEQLVSEMKYVSNRPSTGGSVTRTPSSQESIKKKQQQEQERDQEDEPLLEQSQVVMDIIEPDNKDANNDVHKSNGNQDVAVDEKEHDQDLVDIVESTGQQQNSNVIDDNNNSNNNNKDDNDNDKGVDGVDHVVQSGDGEKIEPIPDSYDESKEFQNSQPTQSDDMPSTQTCQRDYDEYTKGKLLYYKLLLLFKVIHEEEGGNRLI
ncbi:hypothetical protein SAMD00019534_098800 [Acytostelium subglobosum LB1]|uniref:hypothetical protein n=1 Tax=Acytostelium subglobosum LB1 TaxID=1410327 RepID=UPI000644D9EC|nr:hypothetical protein SAMD00019534_098800 [Acytostelium subglobosum LB1]GAM26705.1 hypothetical protein SAMD00019534_098800 [Acytostelium subglobosum LB1]|eukprot:XP_012750366.1 hypothetical protein SAMD00019534_098800 [Acytostelium subglobosum LB1]